MVLLYSSGCDQARAQRQRSLSRQNTFDAPPQVVKAGRRRLYDAEDKRTSIDEGTLSFRGTNPDMSHEHHTELVHHFSIKTTQHSSQGSGGERAYFGDVSRWRTEQWIPKQDFVLERPSYLSYLNVVTHTARGKPSGLRYRPYKRKIETGDVEPLEQIWPRLWA